VAGGAAAVVAGVVIVAVAPATLQLLAALVILDGVVALVWALRVPIARVVAAAARRAGPPGLLAALALERSPARNAATVLGSLLPVAAVVSIGGLQVNVYDTARAAFASLGEADLYVSAQPFDEVGVGPLVPAEVADQVAAQDGVASVGRARFAIVPVGGQDVLVEGIDPGSTIPALAAATAEARDAVDAGDGVVVTRALADRLDVAPGDTFRLPAATGAVTVRVADVVDVFGWAGGVVAASFDDVATWSGTDATTFLEVRGTAAGVDAARRVVAAAGERDGVRYELTDGADAVDGALTAVRQSQALFSALQGVLMASGAFAIVTTLVISTVGRTRELGLLRAVGARRRLVERSVVVEAFTVTLAGAGAGVVLGTVFQFVAVRLAATAAGFPAEFALTPGPSLTAAGAGLGIAAVGAFAALRRALRLDVLDAVAYE
jgi:putative ABC transport system permease protein